MKLPDTLFEIADTCREVADGRRAIKRRAALPTQLIFIATKLCNSRCTMCNIWKEGGKDDSQLEDIRRAFCSPLLRNVCYGQLSGGEPILRSDVADVVGAMLDGCPKFTKLGIASNGLEPGLCVGRIREICERYHERLRGIYLLVSIDGIGEVHDAIRGVPGAYERAMETLAEIERLRGRYPRLRVRVNTVMQDANADQLMEIWKYFRKRGIYVSFSHVTEDEIFLKNRGTLLRSDNGAEEKIRGFIDEISRIDFKRMPYYRVVRERLDGTAREDVCRFGYTSIYIDHLLRVLPCWQGAERPIGSLLDEDIEAKWFGSEAREKVLATRREYCGHCLVEFHKNMYENLKSYCRHPLRFAGLTLSHLFNLG